MSEKETETSLFRVAGFDALYPMRTSGTWEGLVREKPRGCRTVFLHLSLSLLWLANNAVAPFSSAEHKMQECTLKTIILSQTHFSFYIRCCYSENITFQVHIFSSKLSFITFSPSKRPLFFALEFFLFFPVIICTGTLLFTLCLYPTTLSHVCKLF